MFQPNAIGMLSTVLGRDVHARPTFSEATECPFAVIDMNVGADKTVVRADSSASRGSADEKTATHAKILIVNYVTVNIGDRFQFDGMTFKIASRFARRSVMGEVDHYECGLEIYPG